VERLVGLVFSIPVYQSQWSSTLSSCMRLGCFLENLSTTSSKSLLWTCSIARAESLSCPIDAWDQVCKRHNEIMDVLEFGGFQTPQDPPPSYGPVHLRSHVHWSFTWSKSSKSRAWSRVLLQNRSCLGLTKFHRFFLSFLLCHPPEDMSTNCTNQCVVNLV